MTNGKIAELIEFVAGRAGVGLNELLGIIA